MNLAITESVGIKHRLENLLDAAIDMIVRLTDYSITRHITLAEFTLFGFAALRALWFLAFGVRNANYDYILSETIWTALFTTAAGIHLCGFFDKSLLIRIVAHYIYAFMWLFMLFVSLLARTVAPSPPAFAVLTGLTFIVIVRLSRERKDAK